MRNSRVLGGMTKSSGSNGKGETAEGRQMSKHWNPGCAMKNCMTVICKHADGALPELRHFKLALYRVPALFMVIPYNYLGGRERCQFLQVQQLRL